MLRESTLTISDSIEKGSQVEYKIVKVVGPLCNVSKRDKMFKKKPISREDTLNQFKFEYLSTI